MNGTTPSVRDELITEIELSFDCFTKLRQISTIVIYLECFVTWGPFLKKVGQNGDALATVIDVCTPHSSASRAYLLEVTGETDESM